MTFSSNILLFWIRLLLPFTVYGFRIIGIEFSVFSPKSFNHLNRSTDPVKLVPYECICSPAPCMWLRTFIIDRLVSRRDSAEESGGRAKRIEFSCKRVKLFARLSEPHLKPYRSWSNRIQSTSFERTHYSTTLTDIKPYDSIELDWILLPNFNQFTLISA